MKKDKKKLLKSNSLINKLKSKKKSKEELKKLKEIKKKIKDIETQKEFEEVIKELEADEIVDVEYFEKLKKKKKKKLDKQTFEDRIRCDADTLRRISNILRNFKEHDREIEDQEQIQNRDDRLREGGEKEKEKEKNKSREERTRNSGGRSRGSR